jgi:hypothetical protein
MGQTNEFLPAEHVPFKGRGSGDCSLLSTSDHYIFRNEKKVDIISKYDIINYV